MPIDIANTAVLTFELQTYYQPAIQNKGVAFDNVTFRNWFGRCGHFDKRSRWVKQYSGQESDSAYRNTVLGWAQWMYQHIHSAGGSVVMNYSYDFAQTSSLNYQMLNYLDIQLPEGTFASLGGGTGDTSAAQWLAVMNFEQYAQQHGKAVVTFDYIDENDPVNPSAFQYTYKGSDHQAFVQWDLANYLLVKGANMYFVLAAGYSSTDPAYFASLGWVRPEYSAPIGSPVNSFSLSQGAYVRDFTNGKAISKPRSGSDGRHPAAGEYV